MCKKLFMILTGMLFICGSASADIVCVKTKVAANSKIALAKRFQVVADEECPQGFTKVLDLADYEGPRGEQGEEGEKGETGDKGEHGVNFYDYPVYKPGETLTGIVTGKKVATVSLQLPSALEFEVADDEECEGTYDAPTAPVGKICIYPIKGQPRAHKIATGSYVNLITKDLCENAGYDWLPAFCAANDAQGHLITNELTCLAGNNVWIESKNLCIKPRVYGKEYCETAIYNWNADHACYINGERNITYNIANRFDCENTDDHYEICDTDTPPNCELTHHRGEWHAIGCNDSGTYATEFCDSLTTQESCLAAKTGTWVPARCSELTSSQEFSTAGFNVVSPTGEFTARWAVTMPELIFEQEGK